MNYVETRYNAAARLEKRYRDPLSLEWSAWLEML